MVRTEDRTEHIRTETSDGRDAAARFERGRAADYAAAFGRDAFAWRDNTSIPLQAAAEIAA